VHCSKSGQILALAALPPRDPKGSSESIFLDSGSLLKFMSGVHMCEKVGGKRPDFWPLAEALAAVFTLICSFINAAGQAYRRPAF
jgi:predicted Abi (CAAX) family protease